MRAFLLAPLAAPTAFAASWITAAFAISFARGRWPPGFNRGGVDMVLATFALGAPLAYAAMIVAGLPIYFALRRFGALNRWTLWAAAAGIGVVVARLIAPQLRGELFSIPFPWWAGALLGLVTAEVFLRLGGVAQAPASHSG